jgi:EmrB/QacA subfamily drug resistance transporter
VITAYAITFGGFLLLGGRAADLLGRRSVFIVGVAIFTLASLGCGLAESDTFLIVMRGIQGVGGAIIAPAGLSIVSTAFPEGSERNQALGVWGALAGSGAAIGVIAGGFLTKYAGWEWIFFVNIPIGLAVIALCFVYVTESRLVVARRRYDPLGAVAITGAIIVLVFAISRAPETGWGSGQTIGLLIASAVLLGLFLAIESRVAEPLMPLRIWRLRTVTTANIVGVIVGSVMFSAFFLLTFYLQQVLGYSALRTGLALLVTTLLAIAGAGLAEALVTRIGPKYVLTAGLACLGAALLWFTQLPVDGSYVRDLLGPFILMGLGIGFSFVPISIIALAGVSEAETGLASGLMNTSQQVGGGVGLAVAATIFTTRFMNEVQQGVPVPEALVSGFTLAYWVLAIIAFAGCVVAFALLRGIRLADEPVAEHVETHVVSPFCVNRAATRTLTTVVLGEPPEERAATSA